MRTAHHSDADERGRPVGGNIDHAQPASGQSGVNAKDAQVLVLLEGGEDL